MSMLSWVVFPQDQLILKATQSLLDKNVESETPAIISCVLATLYELSGGLDVKLL